MKNMTRRLRLLICGSVLTTSLVSVASPASALMTLDADTRAQTWSARPLETALIPRILPELAAHGTTVFGLPVNEGPIDRSLRALVAAGLIGTGIYGLSTGNISTPVSATLLGVAAIPTLTAATGYCPLYSLFGVDYSF
jgi:hypothetical protein